MYTAKAFYLHLGLDIIYSNYSAEHTVIGGLRGVTHLSSSDSPSTGTYTVCADQSIIGLKEVNQSMPSSIPCTSEGTTRNVILNM